MLDEEETELRNPFPSPPSHYTNYTAHNLNLLALLRERVPSEDVPLPDANEPEASTSSRHLPAIDLRQQYTVLADQQDVPDFPLTQLEPPRVDWIVEDGHYTVFGDSWFVKEHIPTLAEMGLQQLYPEDPVIDRRPKLRGILQSMLLAYSKLMKAVLAPPPPPSSYAPPDWHRYVEWITVLSQNLMAAANELRPVQARVNLEMMMQRQLELRKQETIALHEKCDELETKLAELRSSMTSARLPPKVEPSRQLATETQLLASLNELPGTTGMDSLTADDVLRWAEEIGI